MNTTGELPNPGPVTVTGSASTATPTRAVAAYALARVLGRHYDGIEYRGSHQSLVEELARHAKVPVWNGLTDEAHLTQILADLMRATGKVTPRALAGYDFAAGSTGLKAVAARAFVVAAGQRAVFGSLDRIEDMLAGRAGTQVCTEAARGAGVP